jgi:DNA polymerase-3 subunit epsilon
MTRLWPFRAAERPLGAAASAYATAPLVRDATPWREAPLCALDFELTGLDLEHDEIISFGAVPIDDGIVRLAGAVSGLVRPQREIGEASIRVHTIRAVDLERAPVLDEAIGPLLDVLAGRALVVHTAAVERAHLGRALRRLGTKLRGPVIDTDVLGRIWLHSRDRRLRRHVSLSELAGQLGLPADSPHNALSDALTTAQVFIALASHLDAEHPETVGGLAHAERRLATIRTFHA